MRMCDPERAFSVNSYLMKAMKSLYNKTSIKIILFYCNIVPNLILNYIFFASATRAPSCKLTCVFTRACRVLEGRTCSTDSTTTSSTYGTPLESAMNTKIL